MRTELTMQMPEALEPREVEVTGVAILSDDEYEAVLYGRPLPQQYIGRLNQYTQAVTHPGSALITAYKALLVLGERSENGIAVCGRDHISHAAVFPGAREWLDWRIGQMADHMAAYAHMSGRVNNELNIAFGRLKHLFGHSVTADNGVGELLLLELKKRPEIAGVLLREDCFEISYSPDHGQVALDAPGRPMCLADLIGCNLEEVHLCHVDEDHDLSTIAELNPGTLTEQGKRDWADVLDAKVERIYEGHYGVQIGLSSCDAQRLTDFSAMLAGYVGQEDYDRWVSDGDGPAPGVDEVPGMSMR